MYTYIEVLGSSNLPSPVAHLKAPSSLPLTVNHLLICFLFKLLPFALYFSFYYTEWSSKKHQTDSVMLLPFFSSPTLRWNPYGKIAFRNKGYSVLQHCPNYTVAVLHGLLTSLSKMYSSQCPWMSTDWFLLSLTPHLAWDVSELCLALELCVDTLVVNAACFPQSLYGAETGFGAGQQLNFLSTLNPAEYVQHPWVKSASEKGCTVTLYQTPLPSWAPDKDHRWVKPAIHTKNCHLLLEVTIVSDKHHVYCKVSESDSYYHSINRFILHSTWSLS